MTASERLRSIRQEVGVLSQGKKLSQATLGALVGANERSIRRYESGKHVVPSEVLGAAEDLLEAARRASSRDVKSICGRVELMRSERDEDEPCTCCEGQHVFAMKLVLGDYLRAEHACFNGNSLDDWIRCAIDFKENEGAVIEVTARIVKKEKVHHGDS